MNPVYPTIFVTSLSTVALSSSAAVINLYDNPDGTGMASTGDAALVVSVGDSPTTPGSGQELIVSGDPSNFSGIVRHASLNGTGQGLLTVPDMAESFTLTYEIFLPATGKNFRRDNPFVRFYEDFGIFTGGPNQEFQGFGQGADQNITGSYQTVTYSGTVPNGFDPNYVQFQIQFEQNGDPGNDGDISAFVRNVQFDVTTVPEPATSMLAGLGGLCLLARRRCRD